MPIRLSGLASGLDTEAIVSALVSSYSYKKDKYVKAQTKLSWKQDAWSTLNSKVYSLYTSVGTMRYSSSYSAQKTTVSDTTKATATANGSAINGTQTLSITSLAKTAYLTGGELDEDITGDSNLSALGIKSGTAIGSGEITVKTSTGSTTIELDSTMTIDSFVSKLKDAGVNANFDEDNHRFYISSKTSGSDGDFSLTANNTLGLTGLINLGLLSDSEIDSIESTALSTDLIKKSYTFTDSDSNSYTYTYNADEWEDVLTSIADALATDEASRTDEQNELVALSEYLEDKYASTTYDVTTTDDDGNETTTTYTFGTDGAIDWDSLADNSDMLSALANQIYSDSEYDDAASEATYEEMNEALNAVRDAYVALADANAMSSDTTAEQTAKTAAVEAAQQALNTVLADETNAKWADFIETNFGSTNSDTDDSYSDFWVQSDNLELAESVFYRIDLAANIAEGNIDLSTDNPATKIDGTDAKIVLNGVTYTGSSNSITVNGLTIEALATTTDDISITVSNDTDALYDKIKDFLSSYNSLMNEMQELYNADSAKDYEPLTDDEKAEMSETEIEKWEQKIKDSLLRRDTSLSSIISAMTTAMMKTYDVNGTTYAWSSFGVHTLGTLNAEKNEGYAYHINGDSEDSATSGEEDKLRAALASDPDTVIDFVKQMMSGLYSSLDTKMKSTAVKSVYTVYNDKEMASEYSDYTTLISTWTTRIEDMEDAYYKKFAAMESALATLQSNSSSLSSLLGG